MRQSFLILIELVAFSLAFSAYSWAEHDYKLSTTIGQEYNDNVNETSNPKADLVTIISSSTQATYSSSRIDASVDYQGDFRKYDYGQRQDEILNSLEAKATVQVVKNLLVVDVSDSNHMVFNNATQGQTSPADSTANQVNQNIFTAGALLTPRISDRTQTKIGYKFSGSLYDSSDAVNKYTQTVFADILHELSPRMEVGANIQTQRQNTTNGDLSRYIATVVGRYTYGEGCYLFGQIGAVETVYSVGNSSLLPTGSAGLTHTLGRTIFLLQAQADYVDNPSSVYNSYRTLYSVTVSREFPRGLLTANVGYSDFSGQGTTETKDLTTTAQLVYELTPRLGSLLSVSRINSISSGNNNDRFYYTAELRYQLPKETSIKLYYRLKIDDASTSDSSYKVNIVGLALTKSF